MGAESQPELFVTDSNASPSPESFLDDKTGKHKKKTSPVKCTEVHIDVSSPLPVTKIPEHMKKGRVVVGMNTD